MPKYDSPSVPPCVWGSGRSFWDARRAAAKTLTPESRTKFQRKVTLFFDILKFPFNTPNGISRSVQSLLLGSVGARSLPTDTDTHTHARTHAHTRQTDRQTDRPEIVAQYRPNISPRVQNFDPCSRHMNWTELNSTQLGFWTRAFKCRNVHVTRNGVRKLQSVNSSSSHKNCCERTSHATLYLHRVFWVTLSFADAQVLNLS